MVRWLAAEPFRGRIYDDFLLQRHSICLGSDADKASAYIVMYKWVAHKGEGLDAG